MSRHTNIEPAGCRDLNSNMRLAVLGGGPVGLEMAVAAVR